MKISPSISDEGALNSHHTKGGSRNLSLRDKVLFTIFL